MLLIEMILPLKAKAGPVDTAVKLWTSGYPPEHSGDGSDGELEPATEDQHFPRHWAVWMAIWTLVVVV